MEAGLGGPVDVGCKVNYRGVWFQVSAKCTECPLPECYLENAAASKVRDKWGKARYEETRFPSFELKRNMDMEARIAVTEDMSRAGFSSAEIGQVLGLKAASIRYYRRLIINPSFAYRRRTNGPHKPHPAETLAVERRAKALQLSLWGLPNQMIAAEIGVHRNTVTRLLKEARE